MNNRFSPSLLRSLRNDIPISQVIEIYLHDFSFDNGILRFPCPICHELNTSINKKTNLARCFSCSKNFNPIDLIINVTGCSFVHAVQTLQRIQPHLIPQTRQLR